MATIKMACPKCAQRVSGDETFYGKTVVCPVCETKIVFPKEGEELPPLPERPVHDEEGAKRLAAYEKSVQEAKKRGEKLPDAESGSRPEEKTAAPPKQAESAPEPAALQRKPAASPAARQPAAPALAGGAAAVAPKAAVTPPNSGAALWSMVFGIAAYALCPIGLLLAFPAIVFGHSGRAAIHRSMGKVGGMGMANAGLMLGYSYMIILALIILAGPWKSVGSYGLQAYNEKTAAGLVTALNLYAEDHGGKFPASIEDLVPDYLQESQLQASQWFDPGSVPAVKRHDYTYYPGHNQDDEPKTILLSAPEPDGAYRRLVAYLDGSVEIISEEDFIRRSTP